MKFFIVFAAALAVASAGHLHHHIPLVYTGHAQHVPVIGPNGVPIDTPEVQHARAAHLAAKAEAQAHAGEHAVVAPVWNTYAHHAPLVHADYHTPLVHAAPVVVGHGVPAAYPTTIGVPAVTADGVPLETPEVVAAKAKHFAAHSEAIARNGPIQPEAGAAIIAAPVVGWNGWNGGWTHGVYGAHAVHAVYAAGHPGVTADGVPLDTPEVAAAKAKHLAAHAEAAAHTW